MSTSQSSLRKAAILLRSLDRAAAATLLEQIPEPLARAVTAEVEELRSIDPAEQEQVLRELKQSQNDQSIPRKRAQRMGPTGGIGNVSRAEAPGASAQPPSDIVATASSLSAARVAPTAVRNAPCKADISGREDKLSQTAPASVSDVPFGFLRDVPLKALCWVVQQEHPRVVSVVLSHLPPERAAAVLESLSEQHQRQIVLMMSAAEPLQPALRREVENRLKHRVNNGEEQADGVAKAARLLSRANRATAGKILADLRREDPTLADRIDRQRLDFESLSGVDDATLRCAALQMESRDLAVALKGASPALSKRCTKLLPRRIATHLKREAESLGPVRLGDIEAAQCTMVNLVHEMDASIRTTVT